MFVKPPVDTDLKVAIYYKDLILKHNFQINVNRSFWQTLYKDPLKGEPRLLSKSQASSGGHFFPPRACLFSAALYMKLTNFKNILLLYA